MKSVRHKKAVNSSFLSNHDLLENFRNKSFKLITRESSFSELKQVPKKVSLIQKKIYDSKSKDNKQNEPILSNRKILASPQGLTLRQKPQTQLSQDQQIQRVIKELNFIYDQISTQQIELKMILNKNIRRIKDIFYSKTEIPDNKAFQDKQKELKEKIDQLTKKIDDQTKKIFNYKKQTQNMKEKISLYEVKIQTLQAKLEEQRLVYQLGGQKQNGVKALATVRSEMDVQMASQKYPKVSKKESASKPNQNKQSQIQILQNIIETQEELINKQMTDFQAQNQEFLRMLQIQALKIEELVDKKQNPKQNSYESVSSNDRKFSRFETRPHSSNSTHFNSFSPFTSLSPPQRTQDILSKITKKKKTQGEFSICLY